MIHISTTGTTRNPIGSVAPRDMLVGVGFGSSGLYELRGKMRFYWLCGELTDGRGHPSDRALALRSRRYANREGWLTLRAIDRFIATARRAGRRFGPLRVEMNAPLWSAEWERNARGEWIVVAAGMGFA